MDSRMQRADAASECQTGKLDPDHARRGLYPDAAALQPARIVLYDEVATERDRTREVT